MDPQSKTEPLERAKKAVDDLYNYRDMYFERNSIEKAAQKTQDVAEELERCTAILSQAEEECLAKAEFLMLRGKALNVLPSFDASAYGLLSKAVKLDPTLVEAWIQLGECYWKKGDVEGAKNCFLGALNHSKDKVALRNLSMVLRQLGKDASEKAKLTEESVEKAKEAVQLDIKDGTSWFILGNAYLSLFFSDSQNPKVLQQSMSAYQQAEKDVLTKNNPDLHFNRATAYKYHEDYQTALAGFAMASALDPNWPEPTEKEQQLFQYLQKVSELVTAKGKLKHRRLQSLLQSIKEGDLGPYEGGSYTSHHGRVIPLEHVPLNSLHSELNEGKVVLGKVVCSVTSDDPVPFTFCMVDQAGTCVSVTVYNIAPGYGVKIGDSVAIPEPYLQPVNVKCRGEEFCFQSIRVSSPVVMVVNSRKLGVDKQAPTVLAVSTKSE